MKKQRKHYTAEEKVAILRRHLLEQVPISELCDKHDLQPTVFYRWQKEFFENGTAAFQSKARPNHSAEQERIDYLEKKIQTKDEVLAELMAEHVALKKNAWGTLTGVWVPHDTRDQIVDFIRRWSEKTEIGAWRFIGWLDITASKFYDWRERYGNVNEHNGWVPRDFWLEDWEKQAIIGFHLKNPLEGYRRLTFMMLDADIAAVSPSSVWRVLGQDYYRSGTSSRRRRARALSSLCRLISIGTSTCHTSTSAGRSTTCAAFWTAVADTSSTGICGSR